MKRLGLFVLILLAGFAGACSDSGVKPETGGGKGFSVRLLKSVQAHRGYVFYIDFSGDGISLASGGSDNAVRIWDIRGLNPLKTVTENYHEIWGIPLAYSRDSRYLLIGSFDTVRLLEAGSDYREIAAAKAHPRGVQSVGFSSDGKYAVSAGVDGFIRVWSVPGLSNVFTVKAHETEVWSVTISPDSKYAASGSEDATIRVWTFPELKEVRTVKFHALPVEYVRFSHDGKMLLAASADTTVSVWKTGEWNEPYRLLRGNMGSVQVAEFYTDDRKVFTGGDDNSVYAFDLNTGDIIYQIKEHFGSVMTIAFSRDGKFMATGSRDRTVKLWSVGN